MTLGGLLKRIDLAEGDILMTLNQTIDLLQQVQAAVGQALATKEIWVEPASVMTDGAPNERRVRVQAEVIRIQRERLERLRPLLAQAAASLLHGIIVQSRTAPSMAAPLVDEVVPLDAEEDRDSHGLNDGQTFASNDDV
jgi:hypothetical protein